MLLGFIHPFSLRVEDETRIMEMENAHISGLISGNLF
jgi:hypothetical protein